MADKNTQIIVLSRNYSNGLGVIRALGMAGFDLDLIAIANKKGASKICSCSKYVNHSIEILASQNRLDDGKEIIDELLKYPVKADKIVLFSADDYTTSIMDRNRKILESRFIMPYGETKSISAMMDKKYQGEAAKKAGLITPKEWHVDLREEVKLPEGIEYPVFVKPMDSVTGRKKEMAVIDNSEDLKEHLLKMQETFRNRDIILQEYLKIDKEYDFSGVCLGKEVIIPGILEKINIAKHDRGVTMVGKMLNIEDTPILKDNLENIKKLLQSFDYHGMFDMEMNFANDKLYFGEVNFRSGGPNFSYTLSGANLPELVVKELKGEACSRPMIKEFGKTYVYERMAWEDYINGYITKADMKNIIDGADFKLLENENDKAPSEVFNLRIRLSAIKHKII